MQRKADQVLETLEYWIKSGFYSFFLFCIYQCLSAFICGCLAVLIAGGAGIR
jgi:hypothetical protein